MQIPNNIIYSIIRNYNKFELNLYNKLKKKIFFLKNYASKNKYKGNQKIRLLPYLIISILMRDSQNTMVK